MNDFLEKYGQWALIAGSAEGLGEAFSRALAEKNMNLVMVDRRQDVLSNLAAELEKAYGIGTLQAHLDLSSAGASDRMMESIQNLDCRLMVYNAAFSKVQPFLRNTEEDLNSYIDVNARTPLLMARAFAGKCRDAGGGGMLFMSSLAGLWGTQLLGPYGATKAFSYILAEALHHELKQYGIDVMACIAGATATPAYLGTEPVYGWPKPTVMNPHDVAAQALSQLGRRAVFIPGPSNRLTAFVLSKVLSRNLALKLFNSTTGKMYRKKF